MSRIAYGKHLLKLKRGYITIEQFLNGNIPLDNPEDFAEVEENDLGEYKDHEKAHANVLSDVNIRYKFYLSRDGEIAYTKANEADLEEYTSNLSRPDFLDFLTKLHNPPEETFQPSGTDLFLYKILVGELDTEDKIENYIINLAIN